jgi:hypothetical protein
MTPRGLTNSCTLDGLTKQDLDSRRAARKPLKKIEIAYCNSNQTMASSQCSIAQRRYHETPHPIRSASHAGHSARLPTREEWLLDSRHIAAIRLVFPVTGLPGHGAHSSQNILVSGGVRGYFWRLLKERGSTPYTPRAFIP